MIPDRLRKVAAALLLASAPLPLACFPARLPAQATEGFVSGQVRTAAGAPVVGASVTARNEATGTQQTRTTDARGR
ncbi:MAG: carboxypeptidase-like regulatory domain-containing protein [Gemmatimonas sp.]